MTFRGRILAAVIVASSLLALYPLVRIGVDWYQVSRVFGPGDSSPPVRSFDWVVWEDTDGPISADFVFRSGPAARAGIASGSSFYKMDDRQYFNAVDLRQAIDGSQPGDVRRYVIVSDGEHRYADVQLTRYPTFLYPLSGTLWQFSLWGFTLGAFFHLLGLVIAAPLSIRSRQSQTALILIGLSALWIIGNFARLLAIEFLGPPVAGTSYDKVFQVVTLASLAGWIYFPAVLVRKVLAGIPEAATGAVKTLGVSLYLVPIILTVLVVTVVSGLSPLSLDSLVSPILFYTSCFIAVASLLVLYSQLFVKHDGEEGARRWSLFGSGVTVAIATFFALAILDIVPVLGAVADVTEGWFVVIAQLLSIAPVILVSLATLRYGKVNHVITQSIGYVGALGIVFFSYVGVLSVLESKLSSFNVSRHVLGGLVVVALLVVLERVFKYARQYAGEFLNTERQKKAKKFEEFRSVVRNELNLQTLIQKTIEIVGESLGARSAVLFIEDEVHPGNWVKSTYHPEPPYLTETTVNRIWSEMKHDASLWAYRSELNESSVSRQVSDELKSRGAAIAVPIVGSGEAIGLLVLGRKSARRSVYNLEDIDRIRAMTNQLGLGIERLRLIERQQILLKETTEAQLIALRAQINPHFLFNALNTIVALIAEKPADAEDAVENLASIFRYVLQTGSSPFVKLTEELGLVRHYLDIEQSRFGSKLDVVWDVDPTLNDFPIPAFSIQTVIENAVKHGIEKKREGGVVTIEVTDEGDHMAVRVKDTGVGIQSSAVETNGSVPDYYGIGLKNVSSRMEQLYTARDLLSIASVAGEGTVVTLKFPKQINTAEIGSQSNTAS